MTETYHKKSKAAAVKLRSQKAAKGYGTSMHRLFDKGWSVTVWKKK